MFSLLVYQRYVEFWRDMWSILLETISELPPSPSIFDQGPLWEPGAQHSKPRADALNDKA